MFGALELCPGYQGLLQLTSISVLFSPYLRLDTAIVFLACFFLTVAISGVLDYLFFGRIYIGVYFCFLDRRGLIPEFACWTSR